MARPKKTFEQYGNYGIRLYIMEELLHEQIRKKLVR